VYVDQARYYPSSNDTNEWPELIRTGYQNLRILTCPSDKSVTGAPTNSLSADLAARSFLMNGWNDYFDSLPQPLVSEVLPEDLIREPSDTIVFGEKICLTLFIDSTHNDDLIAVVICSRYHAQPAGLGPPKMP
jgi:hypothetical protein